MALEIAFAPLYFNLKSLSIYYIHLYMQLYYRMYLIASSRRIQFVTHQYQFPEKTSDLHRSFKDCTIIIIITITICYFILILNAFKYKRIYTYIDIYTHTYKSIECLLILVKCYTFCPNDKHEFYTQRINDLIILVQLQMYVYLYRDIPIYMCMYYIYGLCMIKNKSYRKIYELCVIV